MTELSVVIPAFNEEKRLRATVLKVIDYFERRGLRDFEVIVVDDGSRDNTAESVGDLASEGKIRILRNEKNRGKGYSVRRGVLDSSGGYILFSDADLSTPIEEYEKLRAALDAGSADIAIGSRALKDSEVIKHQPFYRETMGKVFNRIARALTFKKIRDSQCGFKLFRRDAAKKLFSISKTDGFAFDAEIIFLAQKMGIGVAEIPVKWVNSPNSRVNPLRDSLNMFFEILKIRIRWMKGEYKG